VRKPVLNATIGCHLWLVQYGLVGDLPGSHLCIVVTKLPANVTKRIKMTQNFDTMDVSSKLANA
jgi:hypothetical protein